MTIRWHTASESQSKLVLNYSDTPSTALHLDMVEVVTPETSYNSHAIQWTAYWYNAVEEPDQIWKYDWKAFITTNSLDFVNLWTLSASTTIDGVDMFRDYPQLRIGWGGAGTGLLELGDNDWEFHPGDRVTTNENGRYFYINGGEPNGVGLPGRLILGDSNTRSGSVEIGNANCLIGFYGSNGIAKQQLDTDPSAEQISTVLRNLGLTYVS